MLAGELIKQKLGPIFPKALFADMAPEGCKEKFYCVYQYISTVPTSTLDAGYLDEDACRIQVDVYGNGETLGAVMKKVKEVTDALAKNNNDLPVLFLGKRTIPEPETRHKRVSLDFSITETVT